MFEILLPEREEVPLYLQLYNEIRERISTGQLQSGMRLPSVRALSAQLNVSKTPIETAYQMLTAEGYVISVPRSGLYIADYDHRDIRLMLQKGSPHESPALHANFPASASPPGAVRFDFNPTALDHGLFPIRTWTAMLKQALEHHAEELGTYGDPQGEPELRSAIADYVRSARGVNCTPEQIVIGSGMAYSIGILAKLLPGTKKIAFEEPGYNLVRDQFLINGYEVDPIPLRENVISIRDLWTSAAQTVYVTPSHQFPTGGVLPYPDRRRLLEWANERGGFIIEDDYDGEFRYSGKPISSLQSLDTDDRVVYIGTFSKALTPTLRLNYMVLPRRVLASLVSLPHEVLYAPSRVEQWAMHAFMAEGHWYRHIRKARNVYRRKHRQLITFIEEHLGSEVEISGQNAGLHLQLSLKVKHSPEELVRMAAEAGVSVYDFRKMWWRRDPSADDCPKLYLGFAGIAPGDMEAGIRLLRQAWFG